LHGSDRLPVWGPVNLPQPIYANPCSCRQRLNGLWEQVIWKRTDFLEVSVFHATLIQHHGMINHPRYEFKQTHAEVALRICSLREKIGKGEIEKREVWEGGGVLTRSFSTRSSLRFFMPMGTRRARRKLVISGTVSRFSAAFCSARSAAVLVFPCHPGQK